MYVVTRMFYLSMAERPKSFRFKNVQLLKDQSLGIGSYGAVCKAKCDDLICAAKIIHPTLFNPTALQQIAPQREHRLPIRRFEQECEFMSAIRHPNIVQYLGIFRDTDTRLPVLLMELMDDSLTHYLEISTQPIPYHIQVNICHDITLALSYLHSNNIIHRDLSSNNVLLRGNVNVLAKVTDFGMARLGDINPHATHFTNTMCPGTDVYMPPEAVQDKPVYTEKIDCFSFGVIIVQILTREFPKPGNRLQEVEMNNPGVPRGRIYIRVPEVDRRHNHLSQLPPIANDSLLPIILDCLKDESSERPSAHQLCRSVADLKCMPKYRERLQGYIQSQIITSSQDEEIQQLRQQLQEKDRANWWLNERERQLIQENEQLRLLQLEKDQELREKAREIEEKERQLGRVYQQLEQVVAQYERQLAELQLECHLRERDNKKTNMYTDRCRRKDLPCFKLRWRKGQRAPCETYRYFDSVVGGDRVYVRDRGTVKIYAYDVVNENWSQLPDCVQESGSLTIINGWLTTVGGGSPFTHTYLNELFSLDEEGSGTSRKWMKKFPPMPTKRRSTTALCTEATLIVAGGRGIDDNVLSTVEVMNTENYQWSTAADLPKPILHASITVCGNQIYMLGGTDKDCFYIKSVYTCSLSALLQSCAHQSLKERVARTSLEDKLDIVTVWRQLADLPLIRSTCESFCDKLLAFGGYDKDLGNSSTAVYVYNSTMNSWDVISHMISGRCACFTAVLLDNQLMVVGGLAGHDVINTIEIAKCV